jgi:hypothetical protein
MSAIVSELFYNGVTVTTSDTNTITVTTGLYVGNTGNVHVRFAHSQANTLFVGVPAGTILRIAVDQVHTTGTAATNIVALY